MQDTSHISGRNLSNNPPFFDASCLSGSRTTACHGLELSTSYECVRRGIDTRESVAVGENRTCAQEYPAWPPAREDVVPTYQKAYISFCCSQQRPVVELYKCFYGRRQCSCPRVEVACFLYTAVVVLDEQRHNSSSAEPSVR